MTNEEIIDYILYERLAPIIDSFDYDSKEERKTVAQLRCLYKVWLDEIGERLYCLDYLRNNQGNSIDECNKLILAEIGRMVTFNTLNKYALEELLMQIRELMIEDKDNPFFKLKRIKQKKQDIEQDFV